MTHYQDLISKATSVTNLTDLNEIEDYMRNVYFHSTLDWQTKAQLNKAARQSWGEIKFMRSEEGKAYLAKFYNS
jgi:hypothetical protein